MSSRIVTDLLRKELAFDGLITTDDMEMAAITKTLPVEEATVRAVEAGCDMVLLCGPDIDQHARTIEALIRAVEEERLSHRRVEEALGRLERVKRRFLSDVPRWRPPAARQLQAVLGRDEHAAIAPEGKVICHVMCSSTVTSGRPEPSWRCATTETGSSPVR